MSMHISKARDYFNENIFYEEQINKVKQPKGWHKNKI